MKKNLIDLSGKRFGKWMVIKRVPNCRHLCVCDCGTKKWVRNNNLLQASSTSCGCKRVYPTPIDIEMRLFSKVEKTSTCWIWKGSKNLKGYGQINCKNKPKFVHRISWEIKNGAIPKGMCVCHSCDIPLCVNPDHLFLATHSQNLKDMSNKKRSSWGEKSTLSKLSCEDVLEIRKMVSDGIPRKIICEKFQVIDKTIRNILNKKTWKHLED